MTDDYPPFRLDLGGMEPDGTLSVSTVATEPRTASTTRSPGLVPAVPARPDRPSPSTRWSGGRVVAMVVGIFLLLGSLGLLGGGAVALWADRTQRDGAGFITSPTRTFSTGTYALTTEGVAIRVEGPAWIPGALGTIRLRVGPTDAGASVFAGIGPTAEVERYLRGVERGTVTDPARPTLRVVPGGPPTTTPGDQTFWFASSLGTDTRTLSWTPSEGSWTVVVMNPDAHPGIDVRANVGATVPALPWIATGLLIAGVLFLLAGTASIVLAARSGSSEGS
jgi:hypothetical protein